MPLIPSDEPDWALLARTENLLILVTHPGEEETRCGALIAAACRQARVPVLAVLTDGSGPDGDAARAERRAAQTRASAQRLGMQDHRVFLLGLVEGTAPKAGTPLAAKLIEALIFLMWSRDCGVIVAPAGAHGDAGAAWSAAEAVARITGVRVLCHPRDSGVSGNSDSPIGGFPA